MKKLMFVVAAMAAGVAMADSIPSSNIVGFTQMAQGEQWHSKIVCFDGVATAPMDLQQIIPTMPAGEELYSGCFQIMTLTSGTATDKSYVYMTAADAKEVDGIEEAAWFNDGGDTRMTGDNAVSFLPGEGFLVSSDLDGATVTFSGAVAEGATIRELGSAWNFIGNNALQALDLQSVQVGTQCDAEGNLSCPSDPDDPLALYSGAFQIMTLTPGTATDKTYVYMTAEDAEGVDGIKEAAWFNDGGDTRMTGDNAVSFASGEGFLISCDYDAGYSKVPGNVIKK